MGGNFAYPRQSLTQIPVSYPLPDGEPARDTQHRPKLPLNPLTQLWEQQLLGGGCGNTLKSHLQPIFPLSVTANRQCQQLAHTQTSSPVSFPTGIHVPCCAVALEEPSHLDHIFAPIQAIAVYDRTQEIVQESGQRRL